MPNISKPLWRKDKISNDGKPTRIKFLRANYTRPEKEKRLIGLP